MTTAVLERETQGQQAAGQPGGSSDPNLDQYDFESVLDSFADGDAAEPAPAPAPVRPAIPAAAVEQPDPQQVPAPAPRLADSSAADDPSRQSVPVDDDSGGNVVAQDVWPADVLADFGLTEQDAKVQFGNPDALMAAARAMDIRLRNQGRQRLAAMQQQAQQPYPQQQPMPQYRQPAAPPVQQPFQPAPQQQPAPRGLPVEPFQMPEGDWDSQTVDLVKRMDEHYRAQLNNAINALPIPPLLDGFETLARQQAQQVEQAYFTEFFRAVAALPPEYAEVFGDIKSAPIDQHSPQFQKLMQLEQSVKGTFAERMASGLPRVGFDQLVPRLAAVEFPHIHNKAAERLAKDKLAKRQSQFTGRPTARVSRSTDPIGRAATNAEAMLRDRGIVPRRGNVDDNDGLEPGEF